MDLSFDAVIKKLTPLFATKNLIGLYVVNYNPSADVLYYSDGKGDGTDQRNPSLRTLSGHIFNVPDGDAITLEQQAFNDTFYPLFKQDT